MTEMTCRDVLDRVEAVAAGDEPATPELRSHLEGCLACAAALAEARRIEAMLAARPAPPAPARFTAAVNSRIRQERWRSEQHVDRMFNIALLMGVLAVAVGVLALFNLNAMALAFTGGLALLNRMSGDLVVRAAPAFATYLGATGFLATALLVWWWAERRLSL
jgi:anti-sigma factor RsiW